MPSAVFVAASLLQLPPMNSDWLSNLKGQCSLTINSYKFLSPTSVHKRAHSTFYPQREDEAPIEKDLAITRSQYRFFNIKLCQSKLIFH